MAEHIHWKKTTNPNYLGTYTFEEGKDIVVKVKDVKIEMIQDPKGGSEEKPVMYFEGNIKPLILNTTNMKTIEKVTGTPYLDEWAGKKLQLCVAPVSAFGSMTTGVRVREFAPQS